MSLRLMMEARLKQERIARGELTLGEIQELLNDNEDGAGADGDDFDFCRDMQAIKLELLNEVRRNHLLERDRSRLDKRIALLIKNRGNLNVLDEHALLQSSRKRTGHAVDERSSAAAARMRAALPSYQHLFYLLQTEPRYVGSLVFYLDAREMERFLDTVLLSLFGDGTSPREEFLTLEMFGEAIERELRSVESIREFLKTDSVVPRMVASYNRRKAGVLYAQRVLEPVLDEFVQQHGNTVLELSPKELYAKMIRDEEVRTGRKSALPRSLSTDELMRRADVCDQLDQNLMSVLEAASAIVDAVTLSLEQLPYGIRWICRLIKDQATAQFAAAPRADDVMRVCSYFVWYRFIQLAIVSPEQFGMFGGGEQHAGAAHAARVSPAARKNLVAVAKVLQNLFNLMLFDAKKQPWMVTVNSWIRQNVGLVRTYFGELVDVEPPEDALQLDRYMELTQRTEPLVVMSLGEIAQTHRHLAHYAAKLAPRDDDPLRVILAELGDAPPRGVLAGDADAEVQLALQNRFKEAIEHEISAGTSSLLAATKELIIAVLRSTPLKKKSHVPLVDYLKAVSKKARARGDADKARTVEQIVANLRQLAVDGVASCVCDGNGDYAELVREIAREVANRASVREQQRKELGRLRTTLGNLREHGQYLDGQIGEYSEYLKACRQHQAGAAAGGGGGGAGARLARFFGRRNNNNNAHAADTHSSTTIGPFRYTHAQLKKKNVLIESGVPGMLQRQTAFYISSDTPGVFHVVGRVGPKEEAVDLEIDDLLEQHEQGVERLELEHVTLDLQMTLALLNKLFLKPSKTKVKKKMK